MSIKQFYYLSSRGNTYPLAVSSNFFDLKTICDVHNSIDPIYDMSIGIINSEGGLTGFEEYGSFKGPEDIYCNGNSLYERHKVNKYKEINSPSDDTKVFLLSLSCFWNLRS